MSGSLRRAPEALESPTRLVTDVATQWLASMDAMHDEDATDPKEKNGEDPISSPKKSPRPVCKKREMKDEGRKNGQHTQESHKKRPKRKFRKSTINVRKEEKSLLLEELAELHTKMEELKARAFATCVGVEARTPSEMQSANRVLRRAIQSQQLECTKIHALMSEYSLFVSFCCG
ncbi:hypothetical protein KRP22_007279 [Phytophthora ramorum]|nr:hypothetical protein KRP22_4711 [Phytophthora ramorum]